MAGPFQGRRTSGYQGSGRMPFPLDHSAGRERLEVCMCACVFGGPSPAQTRLVSAHLFAECKSAEDSASSVDSEMNVSQQEGPLAVSALSEHSALRQAGPPVPTAAWPAHRHRQPHRLLLLCRTRPFSSSSHSVLQGRPGPAPVQGLRPSLTFRRAGASSLSHHRLSVTIPVGNL